MPRPRLVDYLLLAMFSVGAPSVAVYWLLRRHFPPPDDPHYPRHLRLEP